MCNTSITKSALLHPPVPKPADMQGVPAPCWFSGSSSDVVDGSLVHSRCGFTIQEIREQVCEKRDKLFSEVCVNAGHC